MTGPPAAVAAVRRAVRRALDDVPEASLVLVALSGGPDSCALAAALAFEAPRAGLRAGAVIVDHQLQPTSADVAERVARWAEGVGLDPVMTCRVTVGTSGGPEAAAREARYEALDRAGEETGAAAVLLGHTLDDQAETVLLGLARGSGSRSLSGMTARSGLYRRPLLELTRTTTRAACRAEEIDVWEDPHNVDAAFARVRVRERVLPVLETELGPGVAAALARTAALLGDDDAALEQWADAVRDTVAQDGEGLDATLLADQPPAVRRRVLRREALAAGVPGGALRSSHLADLDALVAAWRGQGEVHLPGGVHATRTCGRLHFAPQDAAGDRQ